MYGLIVVLILSAYIGACFMAVTFTFKRSRERKLLKSVAVFFLFNAPLIYYIVPDAIRRYHFCETEAGFWLYKTPEQWALENPNSVNENPETRVPTRKVIRTKSPIVPGRLDEERIYTSDSRFNYIIKKTYISSNRLREEYLLIDAKTGEKLLSGVDTRKRAIFENKITGGCSKKTDRNKWLANGKSRAFYINRFNEIGTKG